MWLGAFLIAVFAIAVIAAVKVRKIPKSAPAKLNPSTEHAQKRAFVEVVTPKPVEVKLEEGETSPPETKRPPSPPETKKPPRYFGADERETKKIPEIEEKVRAEIERRQSMQESMPFLAVCSVLDLDPYSKTLAHEFIVEIYSRLRLQGQLIGQGPHKIPESRSVRIMLESVLEAALGMLLHADENFEVVRNYMPMLLAKRRSLTGRDQYGDKDLKPWIDFSSRFAVDKLKGISSLKYFMENRASNSERSTVSRQGLADMYGGFTRMAIAIIELNSDEAISEVMTGIEYERMLQTQIEEKFPKAHVSTTIATGDQGSDLIVDINGKRIAIQAKYYQSAVGNAAVQEAFSGKGFYEADFAMVVCNSSFTRHAKELSEKLDVVLATTENYLQIIATLVGNRDGQSV